jgi:two-component system response regulator VicR
MHADIILAEDEAFLKETIELELKANGAEVRTSMNGEEAIAEIEKQKPALLLLDLLMPKKDGYAVLQHIREKGYTFPIIILSNLSNDIDRDRCLALGAKDYFIKSDMDEDELWPRIQKHLLPQ